jgi:methionine-rich copper-binding protein CopC
MRIPTCARGLFLALVAWVLGVGLALAHSGLQRAEPPVESALKRPPTEVKLYFTERLEPGYSTVRVEDGQGARVDRDDSHRVSNSRRDFSDRMLRAPGEPRAATVVHPRRDEKAERQRPTQPEPPSLNSPDCPKPFEDGQLSSSLPSL